MTASGRARWPRTRASVATSRRFRPFAALVAFTVASLLLALAPPAGLGRPATSGGNDAAPAARTGAVQLRIAAGAPTTWDPARQGDAGTAAILAQVYEGLTAFDVNAQVQPALARSWRLERGGQRVVFLLRPGLRFSDGSPLTAHDVVASWLRLIDPRRRSPLASLLDDIVGAVEYGRGQATADKVGLRAEGDRVVVDLRRPASYFLSITASPPLGIVPRGVGERLDVEQLPRPVVVSGAYVPDFQGPLSMLLKANRHYWAGEPQIKAIDVLTDLKERSPVEAFQNGELDYTGISASDASWIRYDDKLGPQLRRTNTSSVEFYGFDTTRAPFSDARVRRAFAAAVDWDRLVRLSVSDPNVATSLVPPGVPGRSTKDFSPRHDAAGARALLAQAGYPGGRGFPSVTLVTSGGFYDGGVVRQLKENLGVTVQLEVMKFNDYFDLLDEDPPAFWALSWVADYPAPQDFLGLLAESGSSNNYGRWSNKRYDAALGAAAGTTSLAQATRHYEEAETILRDEAALIPVSYGRSWALARQGLLGANESGLGLLRYAGLAWSNP